MKKVIEHGADSVYMGYSKFNARMFGKNFTISEFKEGITYAHKKGAKVYLTLNTLIKEYELEDAVELAKRAINNGVDGILIQDLGLFLAIYLASPDLFFFFAGFFCFASFLRLSFCFFASSGGIFITWSSPLNRVKISGDWYFSLNFSICPGVSEVKSSSVSPTTRKVPAIAS